MTLKEEVKLLREKVELLERLKELEAQPPQPIEYWRPSPTLKPWEPPYIVTC